MAIAFDATNKANGAATSLTFSHTMSATANSILFVWAIAQSGRSITGVTYNGSAMTLITSGTPTGALSAYPYALFATLSPASGAHNVVVSISGTGTPDIWGGSVSYTGAKQSLTMDAIQAGNGGASSTSFTFTDPNSVANNCWKLALVMQNSASVLSASTGATARSASDAIGNAERMFDSNSAITPAGSYSMSMTSPSSGGWYYSAVTFAPPTPPTDGNFLAFM